MALLDTLPREGLPGSIRARVLTPELVQAAVDQLAHDPATLDAILPEITGESIVPMMDLLLESPERHIRRQVFDRLRSLGAGVVPLALERLQDERWYVTRNLLSLLAQIDQPPEGVDAAPWLTHEDARVRREAVRLAMRLGQFTAPALAAALADQDAGVVSLALTAVTERAPLDVRSPLLALVGAPTTPDELRAAAVKALVRANRAPEVLEALLAIAGADARWSPWRKLPVVTQSLIAALGALAQYWPKDPRAKSVLRQARSSSEPAIRQAVEGGGR